MKKLILSFAFCFVALYAHSQFHTLSNTSTVLNPFLHHTSSNTTSSLQDIDTYMKLVKSAFEDQHTQTISNAGQGIIGQSLSRTKRTILVSTVELKYSEKLLTFPPATPLKNNAYKELWGGTIDHPIYSQPIYEQ